MPYQGYNRLPSQSLAESFELPEQRYLGDTGQPSQQPAQGGYQSNLPLQAPAQNLADVEGLTSAYYDMYGKLQSLAHGMSKEYGLDITKPDFTQPGGGAPFQTYQKLAGNLMTVSNQLGNRLKEQQQAAPYKHTGQITGTGEKNDPYQTTHLAPELEQAMKWASEDFYTAGDAKAAKEKHLDPVISEIQKKAATGDPYWIHQYEVAKGLETTFKTHPSYFRNEDAEAKAKLKAAAGATREIGALKKITADTQGFWPEGSYEVKHENGKTFAIKQAEANLKGGTYVNEEGKSIPLIVSGLKRTSDGKTFMLFKGEQGETIPDSVSEVRVDNQSGDEITRTLQAHNVRLGDSPRMYQALDILDMNDPSGGADTQKLFGPDHPVVQEYRDKLDQTLKNREAVEQQKDPIREKINSLGANFVSGMGNLAEIDTPSGKVRVRKHRLGGGFFIVGNPKEHLTEDEVLNYLQDKGAFGVPSDITPQQSQVVNPNGKTAY